MPVKLRPVVACLLAAKRRVKGPRKNKLDKLIGPKEA